MNEEVVKMPRALKHILFFTTGISGVMYMYKGHEQVGFGFSVMLLACGVLSALASYGLISLVADIKEAGSIKDFFNIFANKIDDVFNNRRSN